MSINLSSNKAKQKHMLNNREKVEIKTICISKLVLTMHRSLHVAIFIVISSRLIAHLPTFVPSKLIKAALSLSKGKLNYLNYLFNISTIFFH